MRRDLAEQLACLERDARYRVDKVLKETACECTERVSLVEPDGTVLGPYIRKRFARDQGIGGAYEKLAAACEAGTAFTHLPRVSDCHDAGEERVVVMELVPGETLDAVIRRTGPSAALAIDVGMRLCDALSELHDAFDPPLIHRDLKPSNIMLSNDSLHLIDFGIARTYSEGARADTVRFGTRDYAPPEQYGFGQTDVRSDVYALGAVLYFCAKGEAPASSCRENGFRGEGLFEPLREVVARAMSLDPAQRYDSALAMRCALEKAAASYFGDSAFVPNSGQCAHSAPMLASAPVRSIAPVPTPPKETRDQPRASAWLREATRRALAAIPIGVGIAWNVMLGLLFALFVAVFVGVVWFPDQSLAVASWPPWCRFVSYGLLAFGAIGPLLYLASDRRLPRRRFPHIFKASILRETAILLAVAFAALVAAFAIAIAGTSA